MVKKEGDVQLKISRAIYWHKKLYLFVICFFPLLLISCGSENTTHENEYFIRLDKAFVQFASDYGSTPTQQKVIASFDGEGIAISYPPNIDIPSWLELPSNPSKIIAKSPVAISLGVSATASLLPGIYSTTIRISSGAKDNFSEEYIDLPISYEVKPSIKVSSASAIGTEFDVTPPKDVPLVVTTDPSLAWTIHSDQSWVTPVINTGKGSQTVMLKLTNTGMLTSGKNIANIQVVSADGLVNSSANFTFIQNGLIELMPVSAVGTQFNQSPLPNIPFTITAINKLEWDVSSDKSWVKPIISSGKGSQNISLKFTNTGILPIGKHTANLTVTSKDGTVSKSVELTFTQSPNLEITNGFCSVSAIAAQSAILSSGDATADAVVYAATPSGIMAAIQLVRLGKTVLLLEPTNHIGGMPTSGIGVSDIGQINSIGGLARQFFSEIRKIYQSSPSALSASLGGTAFEPHVALRAFKVMLQNCGIKVITNAQLQSVTKNGSIIVALNTTSGNSYRAQQFIDASYEGDLMAVAKVSYVVGREANSQYDETLNGVGVPYLMIGQRVDPYRIQGKPSSGLLPHVKATTLGKRGSADKSVMAYNYRLCVTNQPDNKIPFEAPLGYDESEFELLARLSEMVVKARHDHTMPLEYFLTFAPLPNQKFDLNTAGGISTEYVGLSAEYPDADYTTRLRLDAEHKRYMKAILYFMATSKRLPAEINAAVSSYGLCKDEFISNGGWPPMLYVREGRRMVGSFVMTQNELQLRKKITDSIGVGSFYFDSHYTNRVVHLYEGVGRVHNEANDNTNKGIQYPISYQSLIPKREEVQNLFVPVCMSASHAAFTSLRVEPTYMIMGQAAAVGAAVAINAGVPIQDVDYDWLVAILKREGQIVVPTNS